MNLRVTAGARKEALLIRSDQTLGIKVSAPAIENKANERIIELLSKWLKIPKSAIAISKGVHMKNKELEFANYSVDQLIQKITVALSSEQLKLIN